MGTSRLWRSVTKSQGESRPLRRIGFVGDEEVFGVPAKPQATKSAAQSATVRPRRPATARKRTPVKRAAKPPAAPPPAPEPMVPVSAPAQLSLDRVRSEAQRWYGRVVDEARGLLDDVLRGRPWQPKTDLYATDAEVVIRADLAGLDAGAVEILVTGESVVIRGEVPDDAEVEPAAYVHRHRDVGHFERRIPLPVAVQATKVQAKMQRGVLEIRLPIVARKGARATRVKVGGK